MIDTIKISHLCLTMPRPEELEQRGWHKIYNKNTGRVTSWVYKEGIQSPYLSLFVAPDGKVYLSMEVSLPTFIFGSNARLPNQSEVERGLDLLSEYVTKKSGLDFDAHSAMVWKVHFTKDYFVGDVAIAQVISKLSTMTIPRFSKGGYSETTLYFHSKGAGKKAGKPRTICIYDKHKECVNKSFSKSDTQHAKGMMRLEFRYKTTTAVKRLVKGCLLPNREAQTIFTNVISDEILAPVEKQILLLLEETNPQNRVIELTRTYGKRRTATLIQFLVYKLYFGNQFHKIKSLDFSRSAYYKCQRDCRELGIANLFNFPHSTIQFGDIP
jgi:hypothetical protein